MGPQHVRNELPALKKCLAAKCPELVRKQIYSKEYRVCQLTDRIPGHMPECPKETGANCPKMLGCPLLRTGMACSLCMMMCQHPARCG